jgi:hypothetical protein
VIERLSSIDICLYSVFIAISSLGFSLRVLMRARNGDRRRRPGGRRENDRQLPPAAPEA